MRKTRYRRALCALLLCTSLLTPALAADGAAPEADAAGTVSWEDLDERIKSGSLGALALLENIKSIESLDYEQMSEQLRDQLNTLADAMWYMTQLGSSDSSDTLAQTYGVLRETFDSIQDGELQQDNADIVRQLENAVDQTVVAGQTLYINLISMENSAEDIRRGLRTLERTLAELSLRLSFGQVSNQALLSVEQTKAETESQLRSLEATISSYKSQLQLLLGEPPTGELTLGPLPELEAETLDELDYEAGLTAAKEASWELRSAQLTLEDAKEQWNDDWKNYYGSYYSYQYVMAEHTWNAAQLTYQSAVEGYETSFQLLYQSLADYQQLLDTKTAALAYQEKLLDTTEKKYELGLVSHFSVLAAQDEVEAARSAVAAAQLSLFEAYTRYETATSCGILS